MLHGLALIIKNRNLSNMKRIVKIIILSLIIACSTDGPEPEKINFESVSLNCLIEEDTEFIIQSEEEYIQMATEIYDDRISFDCADTTQAPFDLKSYVLLGKYTQQDMNDILSLDVIKDEELKKIIYKIEMDVIMGPGNTGGGNGDIYSSGMNWIIIPKPSDDYKIIIQYTEV